MIGCAAGNNPVVAVLVLCNGWGEYTGEVGGGGKQWRGDERDALGVEAAGVEVELLAVGEVPRVPLDVFDPVPLVHRHLTTVGVPLEYCHGEGSENRGETKGINTSDGGKKRGRGRATVAPSTGGKPEFNHRIDVPVGEGEEPRTTNIWLRRWRRKPSKWSGIVYCPSHTCAGTGIGWRHARQESMGGKQRGDICCFGALSPTSCFPHWPSRWGGNVDLVGPSKKKMRSPTHTLLPPPQGTSPADLCGGIGDLALWGGGGGRDGDLVEDAGDGVAVEGEASGAEDEEEDRQAPHVALRAVVLLPPDHLSAGDGARGGGAGGPGTEGTRRGSRKR